MDNILQKTKVITMKTALNQAWQYLERNPEDNIPKLMDMVNKIAPEGWFKEQRTAIQNAVEERGNWYELMIKAWGLDTGVRNTFFNNFMVNASLLGGIRQEELREKEECNIPWAILLDPTSACNLHCTGCWAAEYGNKLNLTFD